MLAVELITRTEDTHRNEDIGHSPLILLPSLSILLTTPGDVPVSAMRDHQAEECRVEPWEGTLEATDQGPSRCKIRIARVMNLPRLAIPAIAEQVIASLSGDGDRILDLLPWQLRERLAIESGATGPGAEHILLGIAGIPNPVDEQV